MYVSVNNVAPQRVMAAPFIRCFSFRRRALLFIWAVFELCIVYSDRRVTLCVCVCVWQADMMFSSGVFWMGLVFIPITSLVFDVAYKVWVSSRALFTYHHSQYTSDTGNTARISRIFGRNSCLSFRMDVQSSRAYSFREHSAGSIFVLLRALADISQPKTRGVRSNLQS